MLPRLKRTLGPNASTLILPRGGGLPRRLLSSPQPTNEGDTCPPIRWHAGAISAAARAARLGQRGCVVWLTGLSGSGKSTLAHAVEEALHARGRHAYVLDGDNLR